MKSDIEIWSGDEDREDLWTQDPERAALLAYLDVVALWHEQVTEGVYRGVPAMHTLPAGQPNRSAKRECATSRSRPARFTRDDSAGQWVVPREVRSRWLASAA